MIGSRAELDEVLDHEVEVTGLDLNSILGPRQFPELVDARRRIARALVRRGWSIRSIARELRRHHTTIMSLLAAPEDVPAEPTPSPPTACDGTPE